MEELISRRTTTLELPINNQWLSCQITEPNTEYKSSTHKEQECIPVGCVPSAAVAISEGGGWDPPGRGVCAWQGCTPPVDRILDT